MHINKWLSACSLLAFLASTPAVAQETENEMFRWLTAGAQAQLAREQTVVPAGKAAIFVPSMTRGFDEPEVLIYRGDQRIASGLTGSRILVDPGTYTVRVGSGAITQMMGVETIVAAGVTRLVEPTWSGLRVEVVDTNNLPHRGTYELIRVSDREVLGVGFGVDTLAGENLATWLLQPGLYRVVRPGDNFRARTDFSAVYLPEGGLVHYKLVLDPGTNAFRGAAVVGADEFVIPAGGDESKPWTWRHRLGLSIPFSTSKNVVGANNQTTFGADVFFDTYATFAEGPHFFNGILEIEEGLLKVDPEVGKGLPTQKTRDRVRFDALYTRFGNPKYGPYVSVGFLTNVFKSNVLVTQPTLLVRSFLDGTSSSELVPANGTFTTSSGLSPFLLKEGAGFNVRLLRNQRTTVNWRVGVGLRQNLFSDTFVFVDTPSAGVVRYVEVDSFSQEGLETNLNAAVRIGSRLALLTTLDVFADFGEIDEPTVDWRNTLSWRLAGNLSLDYTLNVLRIPQITTDTQVGQSLLLRYTWDR